MATWKADDGTLINYEVHGDGSSGQTLLLLPGLLGSIEQQWQAFVEPLSADYRVLLMDLRGHGRSEGGEAHLHAQRMTADVAGLLEHLQVEAVHVAGYSLGGYLGLMLCLQQPQLVSTLLMHATKFYWTDKAVENMREQLDPDALAETAPAYANRLAQAHGSRWRPLVRQAGDLVARLAQEGLTEGMAQRAQLPVLVSVGDRDEMVSLPEALRLSRIFRRGRLLVLPGVRHPFSSVSLIPLLPMMRAFHQKRPGR